MDRRGPELRGHGHEPTGRTVYGFGGINALRDLFTWIGVGLLPLTLVYGTTRAMLGERGHVAVPIARVVAIAAVLVSYPYWWTEAAAMTDTRHAHGADAAAVATGLHQLMLYAVDGVALGGWQLVDLALMALVAIELLSLIFLKVVIILLGALLYATGPITIGLVATESGAAIARAWISAVVVLIALPVVWATLFAVGALLVGDAGTAGPLIAGNSSVGSLLGGVLLAVAGAASLWMCLRAAREAMGLLADAARRAARAQPSRLAGTGRAHGDTAVERGRPRCGASAQRVAQAAGGAGGELAAAGAGGAAVVRGGRAVGYVGRHGVLGTAAAGGRAAAGSPPRTPRLLVGRSRAGAVAVRMAKAGTAGWYASPNGGVAPAPAADGSPGQHARCARRSSRGSDRAPRHSRRPQRRRLGSATARAQGRLAPQPTRPARPVAQRDAAPSRRGPVR